MSFLEMPGAMLSPSEEISKLGPPKASGYVWSPMDATTRQPKERKQKGSYKYQGKSMILRRPKYSFQVFPDLKKGDTYENTVYARQKYKGGGKEFHAAHTGKKPLTINGVKYKDITGNEVYKARKQRGPVAEGAIAGGAIGGLTGAGFGTARGLQILASRAAEPEIMKVPSKFQRVTTRALIPGITGTRGAVRWAVPGAALGASAGVYHKMKSRKVEKAFNPAKAISSARASQLNRLGSRAYARGQQVTARDGFKGSSMSVRQGKKPLAITSAGRDRASRAYWQGSAQKQLSNSRKLRSSATESRYGKRPPSVWD